MTIETVNGSQQEFNKQQQAQEWSIDVPTIGNIYRQATKVLRFFNGLGRPLKLTDWGNPRHWTNRAWMLQETRPEHLMVNAWALATMPFPLRELVSMGAGDHDSYRRLPMQEILNPLGQMVARAKFEMGGLATQDRARELEEEDLWCTVRWLRRNREMAATRESREERADRLCLWLRLIIRVARHLHHEAGPHNVLQVLAMPLVAAFDQWLCNNLCKLHAWYTDGKHGHIQGNWPREPKIRYS